MNAMTKAVAVALVQVILISSLGAKLLYDRRTCPRAWFKTHRYDPNLPIRGRYLSLQLELKDPRTPEEIASKFGAEIKTQENQRKTGSWHGPIHFGEECGSIAVRDGVPIAVFDQSVSTVNCDNLSLSRIRSEAATNISALQINDVVLFFIPDTAGDLSHVGLGEEVWVLATIPHRGPPRPIMLGIKKSNESTIRPLKVN